MITFQKKVRTAPEEINTVNKQDRPSLSEQITRDKTNQKPKAAIHNPTTGTVKEVEL